MFMVIRLPCTYLCIFFAVLVRLCIFYCVANRCVYSADVLVGSVMFIVRSVAILAQEVGKDPTALSKSE